MISYQESQYKKMTEEELLKIIKGYPREYQLRAARELKFTSRYKDGKCYVCGKDCRVRADVEEKYKMLNLCKGCWETAEKFYNSFVIRLSNKRHKECFLICSAEELLMNALLFKFRCAYTNQLLEPTTDYEIEHLIPIKDGNKTNGTRYNMLLIKQGVNRSKRDKTFEEWYTADNPYLEGHYSEARKQFIINTFYSKSKEFNERYMEAPQEVQEEYKKIKSRVKGIASDIIYNHDKEEQNKEALIHELVSICMSYEEDREEEETKRKQAKFLKELKAGISEAEYKRICEFAIAGRKLTNLELCINHVNNVKARINKLKSDVERLNECERVKTAPDDYIDVMEILTKYVARETEEEIRAYLGHKRLIESFKRVFEARLSEAEGAGVPIACTWEQFKRNIQKFNFRCACSNKPLKEEEVGIALIVPLRNGEESAFVPSNLLPVDKEVSRIFENNNFIDTYNGTLPFFSQKRMDYIEKTIYKDIINEREEAIRNEKKRISAKEKEKAIYQQELKLALERKEREDALKASYELIERNIQEENKDTLAIYKEEGKTPNQIAHEAKFARMKRQFHPIKVDGMELVDVNYNDIFNTPFKAGASVETSSNGNVFFVGVDGTREEIKIY